jgi:hypothetical protein
MPGSPRVEANGVGDDMGQLAFFIEYLEAGGLSDGWVAGCCCSFNDYLGHRSMIAESPALSSWDISASQSGMAICALRAARSL